jgi:hypothetical protein
VLRSVRVGTARRTKVLAPLPTLQIRGTLARARNAVKSSHAAVCGSLSRLRLVRGLTPAYDR